MNFRGGGGGAEPPTRPRRMLSIDSQINVVLVQHIFRYRQGSRDFGYHRVPLIARAAILRRESTTDNERRSWYPLNSASRLNVTSLHFDFPDYALIQWFSTWVPHSYFWGSVKQNLTGPPGFAGTFQIRVFYYISTYYNTECNMPKRTCFYREKSSSL